MINGEKPRAMMWRLASLSAFMRLACSHEDPHRIYAHGPGDTWHSRSWVCVGSNHRLLWYNTDYTIPQVFCSHNGRVVAAPDILDGALWSHCQRPITSLHLLRHNRSLPTTTLRYRRTRPSALASALVPVPIEYRAATYDNVDQQTAVTIQPSAEPITTLKMGPRQHRIASNSVAVRDAK